MPGGFDRRWFLRRSGLLAAAGLAGCTEDESIDVPEDESDTKTDPDVADGSSTGDDSSGEKTQREHPDTIFVDTDGRLKAAGTTDDPLDSIQIALNQSEPGDTIHVR